MAVASTAKTKLIKQLVLVVVIGGILRFGLNNLGWHPPSLEKKLLYGIRTRVNSMVRAPSASSLDALYGKVSKCARWVRAHSCVGLST
jgi:hypothetical protein